MFLAIQCCITWELLAGGVWKTEDGGSSWQNISDGFFGGSIGAVEVAPSNPNVIYVGGGEVTVRGNVSHGYGMWKSTNAGKSWSHIGLDDSRHIPRIRVHPNNPQVVYVAALGHLSGPNQQRGVFRSKDGGATWKKFFSSTKKSAPSTSFLIQAIRRCFTPRRGA